MILRDVLIGIVSLTMLAACGQDGPQSQAEAAAEEAPEEDFPDIIIPEHE